MSQRYIFMIYKIIYSYNVGQIQLMLTLYLQCIFIVSMYRVYQAEGGDKLPMMILLGARAG